MKHRGFTLVELMATIAIAGILVSIALPSYQTYIIKSYRVETMGILQTIMKAQERYYGDNISYTIDLSQLGLAVNSSGEHVTKEDRYRIQARMCDGFAITQCIELRAYADNIQEEDGYLVINSIGTEERVLTNGDIEAW